MNNVIPVMTFSGIVLFERLIDFMCLDSLMNEMGLRSLVVSGVSYSGKSVPNLF